jgi:hypothetical protein
VRSILIRHARRYSEWDVDDLYKLIHQAAMGSGHALTDESGVRDWLMQELAHLGSGPDESLIDPISPDGRIVRVHLRPFAMLHLQEEPLLQAFIRTAKAVSSSTERLTEYATVAVQLAEEGQFPFSGSRLIGHLARMRDNGFPAIHHSARYEQLYQPAYRVVAEEQLPKEIIAAAQHLAGADTDRAGFEVDGTGRGNRVYE